MSKKKFAPSTSSTHRRRLIVIGGHEDKEGDMVIHRELARHLQKKNLVVTTVASSEPEALFETYDKLFRSLGIGEVEHLLLRTRLDAQDPKAVETLARADGLFFTGGDQLRITSQIGDTPVWESILQIYQRGGLIAGTSAGASVMSDTMLVQGNGKESHRVSGSLGMAPGLGLIQHVIVDQHFSERGRFGRLLGAVAQNPLSLGLGIDEDTAVCVEDDKSFRVLGSGAVYVLDARKVTYSNIADATTNEALSIHDVILHVLTHGETFDLKERRPREAARPRTRNEDT